MQYSSLPSKSARYKKINIDETIKSILPELLCIVMPADPNSLLKWKL